MKGAVVRGERLGRGSHCLLSLFRADPPTGGLGLGLGPRLGVECPVSWRYCMILGAPLLDLLHQSLNIYVLHSTSHGGSSSL